MNYFELASYTFIRIILNTPYRMIYPFLTVFARRLGVSDEVINAWIARRALVGAVMPFTIPFIETRGRKFGMLLGLSRKAATDFSFYLAIPTLIVRRFPHRSASRPAGGDSAATARTSTSSSVPIMCSDNPTTRFA